MYSKLHFFFMFSVDTSWFFYHFWFNDVFRRYQKGRLGKKWVEDIRQKLTFTSVTVDLFTIQHDSR